MKFRSYILRIGAHLYQRPLSTTTLDRVMGKSTRRTLLILCYLLGTQLFLEGRPKGNDAPDVSGIAFIQEATELRFSVPDSAISLLERGYQDLLKDGDTLHAVQALQIVANIYGNLANYKDAYTNLWKGLLLADEANLQAQKASLYIDIGRHYSFYKRRLKALEYFQVSLDINKDLARQELLPSGNLVTNYYAFCATYRELNEFSLARKYLDSCFRHFDPMHKPIERTYLQFELACILTAEGDYAEALKLFQETQAWFEARDPSYLVLFYTYMSDAYRGLTQFSQSESYYLKALQIVASYRSHVDFSPIIHQKLSELYHQRGNDQQAYASLKKMKELDARFFDSRSASNQSLLEIQDAFRKEQEAQQKLLQEQKLERLEHQEDVWFLQRVILIVSILFIITLGALYFSYIRARFKAEKQVIRKEKELELQKANEVLEIKNKELAASALKLIEKDENLSLLKTKIKEIDGNVDVRELKKVLKSISISNDRNWEEFETRFVAINESFYQRLQEKFPNLSQRDLKLCALIKLNFSSKEMAKLLGISVESAHTSRYRLRKKLKLTRDVNLTEFIASH